MKVNKQTSKLTSFESLNFLGGVLRRGRPEAELIKKRDIHGLIMQDIAGGTQNFADDPLLVKAVVIGAATLFCLGYDFPRELTDRVTGGILVSGPVQLHRHPDYMSAHYVPRTTGTRELLTIDRHLRRLAKEVDVRRSKLPDDIIATSHTGLIKIFARKYGLQMEPATEITPKEHDAITSFARAAEKIKGSEGNPQKPIEFSKIHISTNAFVEQFKQRRKR